MSRHGWQVVVLTIGLLPASTAWLMAETSQSQRVVVQADARSGDADSKTGKTEAKPKRPTGVTARRESVAMMFVKQHHPELFTLLRGLSENHPKEYEQAVADLARVSERLAQVRENDPTRYDLELKLWKAQSQIELLTAQLRMQDDRRLRDQLRETLREKLLLQKLVLEHDRGRVVERLSRIDQQIERLEQQGEQMVERQLQFLLRTERSGRPKREPPRAVAPADSKPSSGKPS